jgi:hypothetical protein
MLDPKRHDPRINDSYLEKLVEDHRFGSNLGAVLLCNDGQRLS